MSKIPILLIFVMTVRYFIRVYSYRTRFLLFSAILAPPISKNHYSSDLSQNLCGNDSPPTFTFLVHRLRRYPIDSGIGSLRFQSFQLLPAENFLRVPVPILFPVLQKLFPSKTMASSGVSSSVGAMELNFSPPSSRKGLPP